MEKLDLLENLQKNNAIRTQLVANNWQEAIRFCIEPLVTAQIVDQSYCQSIIESVQQNGPYFIIAEYVAMPHAQTGSHVFDNGFSLITLKKPIFFENDNRPVSVLIGLASSSADVHVSIALPQIVAIFENAATIKKIIEAQSSQEVIEIIQKIDLKKYLS